MSTAAPAPGAPRRRPDWPAIAGGVAVGTAATVALSFLTGTPVSPVVSGGSGTLAPVATTTTQRPQAAPNLPSGRRPATQGTSLVPTADDAGQSTTLAPTGPPGTADPGRTPATEAPAGGGPQPTSGGRTSPALPWTPPTESDVPEESTGEGSATPAPTVTAPTVPVRPATPTEAPSDPGQEPTESPTATTTEPTAPASSTTDRPATNGPVEVTGAIERGVVLVEAADGTYSSAGTGMILTPDGYLLTNYHVVRATTEVSIKVPATGRRYSAALVGRDATRDVALLKISGASGLRTISPDPDAVAVGDRVVAAGNAGGQGYLTAFSGSVLAVDQRLHVKGSTPNDPPLDLTGLIQTDAHAEPGDSGGPLFDAEDEVLGMTTAGAQTLGRNGTSSSFAIPISSALAIVDQIRAGDESGTVVIGPKASLGVMATNDADGVLIKSVTRGSAAAQAGLKSGGHLTALGGVAVASTAELANALDRFQPGETTLVEWTDAAGTARSTELTFDASDRN